MKIFEHKESGKSYIIYIQTSPYPYLDGRDRLGVWAHPYLNKEDLHNFFHILKNQLKERKCFPSFFEKESLFFKSTDYEGACKKWIQDNFEEISEI